MADSDSEIVPTDDKLQTSRMKSVDLGDQNELDYDDDEENEKKGNLKEASSAANGSDDGEIEEIDVDKEQKKPNYRRKEREEGEEEDESGGEEEEKEGKIEEEKKKSEKDDSKVEKPKEETESDEEDGEINDGEKPKKAFIPRVLCKYYQRGKCSWGRGCKFLHPGVNDTGNYSFLEFQDPNAKVFQRPEQTVQQTTAPTTDADSNATDGKTASSGGQQQSMQTETAWERGLRHAKEMKERAMRRKQLEKDQFDDKKMNLSLKDFENEKENDERYINADRPANADEGEEEEDEEMRLYASRLNRSHQETSSTNNPNYRDTDSRQHPSAYRSSSNNYRQNTSYESGRPSDRTRPSTSSGAASRAGFDSKRPSSPPPPQSRGGNKPKQADDWHDPWDRSRQQKKSAGNQRRDERTSNSYSSSDSDSRSRSRSRSSYSSKSSYSSRSSSYSDRSNSPAQRKAKTNDQKRGDGKLTAASRLNPAGQKSAQKTVSIASVVNKSLPGRSVPDLAQKKANVSVTKKKRSRSNSSASSYSSGSKSDDDDDDDSGSSKNGSDVSMSASESDSDQHDDEDFRRTTKKPAKPVIGAKRPAKEDKSTVSAKKTKTSKSPPRSKDKKQLIKDQLKMLESALKKKAMSK